MNAYNVPSLKFHELGRGGLGVAFVNRHHERLAFGPQPFPVVNHVLVLRKAQPLLLSPLKTRCHYA